MNNQVSTEILTTCKFLPGNAEYVAHTNPTQGWDSSDGYDDIDYSDCEELELVDYRLEVQTVEREGDYVKNSGKKFFSFRCLNLQEAIEDAEITLINMGYENAWQARLWNESMDRVEYRWDVSDKYSANPTGWTNWYGNEII